MVALIGIYIHIYIYLLYNINHIMRQLKSYFFKYPLSLSLSECEKAIETAALNLYDSGCIPDIADFLGHQRLSSGGNTSGGCDPHDYSTTSSSSASASATTGGPSAGSSNDRSGSGGGLSTSVPSGKWCEILFSRLENNYAFNWIHLNCIGKFLLLLSNRLIVSESDTLAYRIRGQTTKQRMHKLNAIVYTYRTYVIHSKPSLPLQLA